MKNFRFFLAAVLVIFSIQFWAQAEVTKSYSIAGIDDPSKVDEFLKTLQGFVSGNKKEEIANIVNYPLTITISGKKRALKNMGDFLDNYAEAFNSNVKEAVLKQKPSD